MSKISVTTGFLTLDEIFCLSYLINTFLVFCFPVLLKLVASQGFAFLFYGLFLLP